MAKPRPLLLIASSDIATDRIEIPIEGWQPEGMQPDAMESQTDEWWVPKIQIGPLDV